MKFNFHRYLSSEPQEYSRGDCSSELHRAMLEDASESSDQIVLSMRRFYYEHGQLPVLANGGLDANDQRIPPPEDYLTRVAHILQENGLFGEIGPLLQMMRAHAGDALNFGAIFELLDQNVELFKQKFEQATQAWNWRIIQRDRMVIYASAPVISFLILNFHTRALQLYGKRNHLKDRTRRHHT